MSAWFYILRLKSGALYIGATTDLNQRYKDHCSGKACRTTSLHPPVALLYSEELETFSDARRREAQVKRWSRGKRGALASGDLETLHQPQNDASLDPPFLLSTRLSSLHGGRRKSVPGSHFDSKGTEQVERGAFFAQGLRPKSH